MSSQSDQEIQRSRSATQFLIENIEDQGHGHGPGSVWNQNQDSLAIQLQSA
jgi:hypothetical protein